MQVQTKNRVKICHIQRKAVPILKFLHDFRLSYIIGQNVLNLPFITVNIKCITLLLKMLTRAILATTVTYLGMSHLVFFLQLLPPIQNCHEVGNQVPFLPQVIKLCSQATIYWTMSGQDMSFVLTNILHQQSQSVLANLWQ